MTDEKTTPNRWLILIMVQLAVFMSTFEISVVGLALPIIQNDFGVTLNEIKWVAVVYSATNALALPIAAYLGRRLGVVAVYRSGQFFFAAATVCCGFAASLESLVALRFVSGIGASFILALNNVILLASFPREQHGLALGVTGSTFSLGIVSGLAAGGVLTQSMGWQSVFFVNLAPALPMLGLSLALLRGDALGIRREALPFDWRGLALAFAALGTCVHVTGSALRANAGYSAFSAEDWVLYAVTALLLGIWLRHEFADGDSFLNLHLLKTPPLSFIFANGLVVRSATGAINFIIPFYLQSSLHLSPIDASMVLSAGAIAMGLIGPFAGRFLDRYGALQTMRVSLVLMTLGALCYVLLPARIAGDEAVRQVVFWVVGAQFLIGAGSVFFSGAVTFSSLRATVKERWGVVSGLQSVNLMIGTALGASLAAELVAAWGRAVGDAATIPDGALFALFGALAATLALLAALCFWRKRAAYDALLDSGTASAAASADSAPHPTVHG